MNNLITPNDLGRNLVEYSQQIDINDFVSKAMQDIKLRLVEAQVVAQGYELVLTTSKTRFNGERFWFICPICKRRVGKLYKHQINETLGCRLCLNLKYKSQRFKGMIEATNISGLN